MTTAHRPTWKAAVGQANEGGYAARGAAVSALDMPAHIVLKTRKGSQVVDRTAALQQSLLDLEQAEAKHALPKRPIDERIEEQAQLKLLKQTADVDEKKLKEKYDDSDVDDGGGRDSESTDLDDSDSDDDLSSDDDDEDDEAALQAELTKIRAEREQVKVRAQKEADAEENAKQEEAALLGNPLLSGQALGGSKKRRWNEDVVFRNQAKGEPEQKKRFINDTVRNDFHKRFLNKFIR